MDSVVHEPERGYGQWFINGWWRIAVGNGWYWRVSGYYSSCSWWLIVLKRMVDWSCLVGYERFIVHGWWSRKVGSVFLQAGNLYVLEEKLCWGQEMKCALFRVAWSANEIWGWPYRKTCRTQPIGQLTELSAVIRNMSSATEAVQAADIEALWGWWFGSCQEIQKFWWDLSTPMVSHAASFMGTRQALTWGTGETGDTVKKAPGMALHSVSRTVTCTRN